MVDELKRLLRPSATVAVSATRSVFGRTASAPQLVSTPPPPPKPKVTPTKDQIARQIYKVLAANLQRVQDLFREWDDDNSGTCAAHLFLVRGHHRHRTQPPRPSTAPSTASPGTQDDARSFPRPGATAASSSVRWSSCSEGSPSTST